MADDDPITTPSERRQALDDLLSSPEIGEFRAMLQERDAAYDEVAARLAADGIAGVFITTACPVQFEGDLPDGSHVYFRSRWDQASLDVWDPGVAHEKPYVDARGEEQMVSDFGAVSASYDLDEDFDFAEASWLESDQAEAAIRTLIARHHSTRP